MIRNILMVSLLFVGNAMAMDRTVSVNGSCIRDVVPDRGSIVLTAEIVNKDLKEATRKSTEIYDRVKEKVKKLGLNSMDLNTVEYNVQELKEWEKDHAVSKGYRARMGLKVSTQDIHRLGEVIAIASQEGVRDVSQLTTYLSDQKQAQEYLECLAEAAENARVRADKLAKALSAKIGGIQSINEMGGLQGGAPPPPMMAYAMSDSESMGRKAMPAPSVEAGKRTLNVSVQAVFALQ